MHRSFLAAALAAIFVVVACGGTTVPSPSTSPDPTAAPSEQAPSPTVTPSDAPPSDAPTETPTEAPSGPPATPTAEEQALIDGVRDGRDCQPVRVDLPTGAIAGIECTTDDPAVARIGFYRFADDDAMLAAYFARMAAEGIATDSGSCVDGEGEGAYTPGEGEIASREGCFINDEGYANYRATLPGSHVYVGILGSSDDMTALADFAWLGSQDTPGNPTVWGESAS